MQRDTCLAATQNGTLIGLLSPQAPGIDSYNVHFRALFRRFSPFRSILILANLLILHSPSKPGELLVDLLAVAPAARGRGVGTLLLDAARSIRCNPEELQTNVGTHEARLTKRPAHPDARPTAARA